MMELDLSAIAEALRSIERRRAELLSHFHLDARWRAHQISVQPTSTIGVARLIIARSLEPTRFSVAGVIGGRFVLRRWMPDSTNYFDTMRNQSLAKSLGMPQMNFLMADGQEVAHRGLPGVVEARFYVRRWTPSSLHPEIIDDFDTGDSAASLWALDTIWPRGVPIKPGFMTMAYGSRLRWGTQETAYHVVPFMEGDLARNALSSHVYRRVGTAWHMTDNPLGDQPRLIPTLLAAYAEGPDAERFVGSVDMNVNSNVTAPDPTRVPAGHRALLLTNELVDAVLRVLNNITAVEVRNGHVLKGYGPVMGSYGEHPERDEAGYVVPDARVAMDRADADWSGRQEDSDLGSSAVYSTLGYKGFSSSRQDHWYATQSRRAFRAKAKGPTADEADFVSNVPDHVSVTWAAGAVAGYHGSAIAREDSAAVNSFYSAVFGIPSGTYAVMGESSPIEGLAFPDVTKPPWINHDYGDLLLYHHWRPHLVFRPYITVPRGESVTASVEDGGL